MAKRVRLSDIAEKLGVSTVTVSKALSDQKGVSDELRDEIKTLADKMGYKSLSEQKRDLLPKSYNIGILISDRFCDETNSFYWKVYQEVATKTIGKGSFTMLEVLSESVINNLEMPKIISDGKADGIIIIGALPNAYFDELMNVINIPYICLDFYDLKYNSDAIISDNYYGMCKMVNHLFDCGHRDISFVGTLNETDSITDRFMGYCKACLEHGVSVTEDMIIADREKGGKGWDDVFVFDIPEKLPTAFACNCDDTAVRLMHALEKKGIRVPEDVSVVGFDNFNSYGTSAIGITTYEVDMKGMAGEAINNLIKKIRGENYKRGTIIVDGNVIIKESVRNI